MLATGVDYNDATSEGLAKLRAENERLRKNAWPRPYDETQHRLRLGDARDSS